MAANYESPYKDVSAKGMGLALGEGARDINNNVGVPLTNGAKFIGKTTADIGGRMADSVKSGAQYVGGVGGDFVSGLREGFGYAQGATPKAQGVPTQPAASSGADKAKAVADNIQEKYFQPSTGSLPTPGADLAGVAPRGVNVYNTYDPDRPASMGAAGNNPWQDMARQLANFSALRAASAQEYKPSWQDQHGSYDPERQRIADSNALLDKWGQQYQQQQMQSALSGARTQSQRQAILGAMELGQRGAQAGLDRDVRYADIAARTAGNQLDAKSRLTVAQMQGDNQMAAEGLRGRNQLQAEGIRGEHQLAAEGLRGRNQMQSHLMGIDAQGINQRALKLLEQDSPEAQAKLGYYGSAAKENEAKAALYGIQGEEARNKLAFDKSADASIQRWAQSLMKDGGLPPDQAMAQALKYHLASKRAAAAVEKHADGGMVGVTDPAAKPEVGTGQGANYQWGTLTMKEKAEQQQQQATQQRNNFQAGIAALGGMVNQQGGLPTGQFDFGQMNFGAPAQPANPNGPYKPGGLNDPHRVAFAQGGPIGVGGRMVLGEGDGKSDSLPAVIDGERPAALSTGEFVMPVEAVQHFGLAKLNKMVEQSRKGLDTGRRSA